MIKNRDSWIQKSGYV